jgi:DNA-binding SARP family transcriptional activator
VRLRLLGEPALETNAGAQPVAFPLERKAAGLLALVAIDGPTPRAKVAAMLWPDTDAAAARNNLRQTLHRLHRRAGREVADTASDVLQLAADVECDVATAADALASDASAAGGDLLGSFDFNECEAFAAWLQAARERWRATRRDMLAQIASGLEKDGHIALALHYAQRLVADDPLLEHAHRRLIRLHYLRGDRTAALAAFAACRAVLRRELGASPAPETAQLARLVEASGVLPAPAAEPAPVPVLSPPRLVGRDTEWQRLAVAGARQRFVVVSGEPGVGKSRLLSEFAARHDGFVAVGARPGDANVPFMVLARLLRAVLERFAPAVPASVRMDLAAVLPELGGESEGPVAPLRLHQAAAAVLEAAPGLAGCIVDDLHFADDASLDAIVALASASAALPLHWLVAVRPSELPAAIGACLDRGDLTDVDRLALAPLDAPAVRALLRSLAVPGFDAQAWAEPLARHTGGNPLFILETVRQLLADGPLGPAGLHGATLPASLTVERLIEQRLGQLTPEALRLARLAALAPGVFSPALAARVLRLHPLDLAGAWRELEAAQVLRQNAFVHGLVFEATLRSVPEAIASLMRRDIAAALADGAATA